MRPPLALAGARCDGDVLVGVELAWSRSGRAERRKLAPTIAVRRLKLAAAVEVLATVDGAPALTFRSVGRGAVATLAFHPSRDRLGGHEIHTEFEFKY